jgi:hypothetical protein
MRRCGQDDPVPPLVLLGMVDPLTATPDPRGRSGLVIAGLGCLVVAGAAILLGFLALPWLASAFLFYKAVQAGPTADVYREAVPCKAGGSAALDCLRLVHGTVDTVVKTWGGRAGGVTTTVSVALPSGIQSTSLTTLVVTPPGWLQGGEPVDVTLYEGKITRIAAGDSQTDTDDSPVVHQHDLFFAGLIALGFGVLMDGGLLVSMRRRV